MVVVVVAAVVAVVIVVVVVADTRQIVAVSRSAIGIMQRCSNKQHFETMLL